MKVVTLDAERFRRDCRRLMDMATHQFQPDVVVGIRTGGLVVAETMGGPLPLLPITRRRPSTNRKQRLKLLARAVRLLPYAVSDTMRRVEHRLLTRKPAAEGVNVWVPVPEELEWVRATLAQLGKGARVLVVDDAVDTGATLRAVVQLLRDCDPTAEIRCAALAVTTTAPLMEPDYCLYRNQLCRFPWSHDFRG